MRTILLTLIALTTSGSLRLLWLMRDDVRDSKRRVGDPELNDGRGTGIFRRLHRLERDVHRMKSRNDRIDLVFRQYTEDMAARGTARGVVERASDRVIRQAVEAATEVEDEETRERDDENGDTE